MDCAERVRAAHLPEGVAYQRLTKSEIASGTNPEMVSRRRMAGSEIVARPLQGTPVPRPVISVGPAPGSEPWRVGKHEPFILPEVTVMMMGWKSACGFLPYIHRRLVFSPRPVGAGLPRSTEIRTGSPIPGRHLRLRELSALVPTEPAKWALYSCRVMKNIAVERTRRVRPFSRCQGPKEKSFFLLSLWRKRPRSASRVPTFFQQGGLATDGEAPLPARRTRSKAPKTGKPRSWSRTPSLSLTAAFLNSKTWALANRVQRERMRQDVFLQSASVNFD